MYHPTEGEHSELVESTPDPRLVLDGTVSLEDVSDDEVARVKGLIELINDFLRN
jgi:hypothetical protein